MSGGDVALTVDDLDSAGRRSVVIGFLWRGLVLNVLVALGGAFVGFLISFVFSFGLRAAGVETSQTHRNLSLALSATSGFLIGIYGLWEYIRWMFRVQLGGYRLRLIPVHAKTPLSASVPDTAL